MNSCPRPPTRFLAALALLVITSTLCRAGAGLKLQPHHEDGLYAVGQTVGWTIETSDANGTRWTYSLKQDNLVELLSGELDLTRGTAVVEIVATKPAMIHLELSPYSNSGDHPRTPAARAASERVLAAAAVSPEQLQPSKPAPADFEDFWAEKLAELRAIPLNPVLTPGESGREGVEYATLALDNIGGAHVYGQIAKPARQGKFPALLLLLWASPPYPFDKAWVTDRAAEGWLALNVMPHDVPGNLPTEFYAALPQLIKNYNTIYDNDRDRNYFLQMYLGDVRAVDYLQSRPDWNGEVLLVTGTSMGGQQSLAVAGLHSAVTHLIVHVPAGADSNGALHGRAAGYPNWDSTRPDVMRTALYFDTVNLAAGIKATSLVSMGFIDEVCPPAGIWAAFNRIQGPKEVVPLVDSPHNHQATVEQQRPYTERAEAWMSALVQGRAPDVRPLRAKETR